MLKVTSYQWENPSAAQIAKMFRDTTKLFKTNWPNSHTEYRWKRKAHPYLSVEAIKDLTIDLSGTRLRKFQEELENLINSFSFHTPYGTKRFKLTNDHYAVRLHETSRIGSNYEFGKCDDSTINYLLELVYKAVVDWFAINYADVLRIRYFKEAGTLRVSLQTNIRSENEVSDQDDVEKEFERLLSGK